MKKILILLLFLIMAGSGCRQRVTQDQFHKLENGVWERFDFLKFGFVLENVKPAWNIYLVVRYDENIQIRYLPLNIEMITPSGESRVKDYNIFLRSINDEYLGEKKDGFYESKTLTHPEITFSEIGQCTFEIENLNPNYFTYGIREVGIIIEQVRK
ncbi:MAG: hypothetical protein EOM06_04380 [Sphingobacteriia bacterium]|nr:hypothetical protein [Sphingobacteriia bacterium]